MNSTLRTTRFSAFARVLGMGIVLAIATGTTRPASADIVITNHMESTIEALDGIEVYDYSSATKQLITTTADWDAGTYMDTIEDAGSLTLERFGDVAPQTNQWWDTLWRTRRCYEIDNSDPDATALTEYQFRVELDTAQNIADGWMQPAGQDLRAIADDGTTVLPMWLEGPTPATDSAVWVQVDSVPVGVTSFCLYWNNAAAPSVSNQIDVFTYTTPKPIYYTVSRYYNGATAQAISYVNGNQVQAAGGPALTLNQGVVTNLTGLTANSVISATGPITARRPGSSVDHVVPISLADTEFVISQNRGTDQFDIVAPFATANVRIWNGNTLAWTGVVTPGTAASVIANVGAGNSGVIRSDEPILVVQTSTSTWDGIIGARWTGADIFGVRSRNVNYGFTTAGGTATALRSDGTTQTLTSPSAGSMVVVNDPADFYGDGTAVRVTNMTNLRSVTQQADGNGGEATAFLPVEMLDNEYWIPTLGDYIAVACPTPGTQIVVSGIGTFPCTNTGLAGAPGHAVIGTNASNLITAGTRISSSNGTPFFAYWQDGGTSDETNTFGVKGARQWSRRPPVLTTGAREGIHTTLPSMGMWTSPPIDTATSGVYGLANGDATTPAGTSVQFQMATGATAAGAAAAPLVGPDGTAATFYTIDDDPISYGHDLDRWFVVKATLSTTDPLVAPAIHEICVGTDLQEFPTHPAAATVASPAGTTSHNWVARIRSDNLATSPGMVAQVRHRGDTGLANTTTAAVFLDGPVDQVLVTASAIGQTIGASVPWGTGSPTSIGVDSLMTGGSTTLEITWLAADPAGGPVIEHDLDLTLSG